MSAETLSRTQIEDLLKGTPQAETEAEPGAPSTMTDEEGDEVRRYAEIVASSAGGVLSTLLGDVASVSAGEITETDSSTIQEQVAGKVVAFKLNYKGLIHGQTLLAIDHDQALKLAGQLAGGGEIDTIEDYHETALGDAVQDIISQANTDLSSQLGGDLTAELLETVTAPDDLAEQLPPSDEPEILVNYRIQSELLEGTFSQVLPRNLVHGLVAAAGRPEEGPGTLEDERAYASAIGAPDILEQPATFQPQIREEAKAEPTNLDLILDIPLEVKVELGRTSRKIREVLEFGPGSVVELEKISGEPVDVLVNDKLFARGEVVVIDENFGVRITDILTIEERIEALK